MKAGRGSTVATSMTCIRDAQRRAEMLELRFSGLTLEQIGERMGVVGKGTVSRVISNVLTAEELLPLELGRCDILLNEAMQTVKASHPLARAGRVRRKRPMLNNVSWSSIRLPLAFSRPYYSLANANSWDSIDLIDRMTPPANRQLLLFASSNQIIQLQGILAGKVFDERRHHCQ